MNKKITSALISVFYKDGLEPVVRQLHRQGATIYTTGGTQKFIEDLGIPVVAVETITTYPSILGGRVKTLHPSVFGGILGRRNNETDVREMEQYNIPAIDLVIVDLYPFEQTLEEQKQKADETGTEINEATVIEKIDIGGPSLLRAAAKNFESVMVVSSKDDYEFLVELLVLQNGEITLEQRRIFATNAFTVVARYDVAINEFFLSRDDIKAINVETETMLRYGENPHQHAFFYGDITKSFTQLNGKELSYNNLVDVDAAIQMISEFTDTTFAIIKHTNVCGIAVRDTVFEAWQAAFDGDPESAFGGVLVCNKAIDASTAYAISEIFFEVLIAPSFSVEALQKLITKKNRILLELKHTDILPSTSRSILHGTLFQDKDFGNFEKWEEVGARQCSATEKEDLQFANLVCKHLKSNAIALVKNKQLIGKGCGQTSRIDA
ncbi:MAG: bifunctional phosphoribosylaminoimidazolecarboxamide formyltransferase/IMP cyclohydrolase, partial [Bacteroidota bacterium]